MRAALDIIDSALLATSTHTQAGGRSAMNWKTMHGLFLNAIYGGRIDNDSDIAVLATYLHQFFNDEVLGSGSSSGGAGPNRGRLAKGVSLPKSNAFAAYAQAR